MTLIGDLNARPNSSDTQNLRVLAEPDSRVKTIRRRSRDNVDQEVWKNTSANSANNRSLSASIVDTPIVTPTAYKYKERDTTVSHTLFKDAPTTSDATGQNDRPLTSDGTVQNTAIKNTFNYQYSISSFQGQDFPSTVHNNDYATGDVRVQTPVISCSRTDVGASTSSHVETIARNDGFATMSNHVTSKDTINPYTRNTSMLTNIGGDAGIEVTSNVGHDLVSDANVNAREYVVIDVDMNADNQSNISIVSGLVSTDLTY